MFGVAWVLHGTNPSVVQWCAWAIVVVIVLDYIDGIVARLNDETTQFGAIFDIIGDRITEMICWIVFAGFGLIPIWVPMIMVARGFIVDGLRSASYAQGMTPFGDNNMMRSKFTTWLTAGRPMRAIFATAKCCAFFFLAVGRLAQLTGGTDTWLGHFYTYTWFLWLGWFLVWSAVILSIVRALPVVFDAIAFLREKNARPRPAVDEAN